MEKHDPTIQEIEIEEECDKFEEDLNSKRIRLRGKLDVWRAQQGPHFYKYLKRNSYAYTRYGYDILKNHRTIGMVYLREEAESICISMNMIANIPVRAHP